MDPEYVSGGGAAKNIEEKVVAVFDREFALALQQVDVKDQDQLVLDSVSFVWISPERGGVGNYRPKNPWSPQVNQSKLYEKNICLR